MSFNIQDSVLADEIDQYFDAHAGETWTCHLYKNNYTPVPNEIITDYVEADFNGYAAVDFDPADFDPAVVLANVAGKTLDHSLDFTHGSSGIAQTVYGYFITDDAGDLAWGERFATARTLQVTDVEKVTPRYFNKNC